MKKKYIYDNVEIKKIIDGDTIDVCIDLGFNIYKDARIRFYGINAPETKGVEKELGLISKQFLADLIPVGSFIKLEVVGKCKYGRWLGIIYKEELNINKHMVKSGQAIEYMI